METLKSKTTRISIDMGSWAHGSWKRGVDRQKLYQYDASSRDGISVTRSFLKHYANPLEDWVQFWPVDPPAYRKKMRVYAVEIQRVSMQIMEAILQGLGLGPSYLQEKVENGVQFLALNNYPQFAHQGDEVGLSSHSDYGFITILVQSSPGLEVMHHGKVAWTAIPAISGALHVHVGDNLEVLSNGQLKSLVHRAILNPDEPFVYLTQRLSEAIALDT